MKLSESKAKETIGLKEPSVSDAPRYPYGICLNLEKETLKKLSIDVKDYKVGDKILIMAVGEISRLSQSASMNSGKSNEHQSMDIQLTAIGVKNPNKFEDAFSEAAGD